MQLYSLIFLALLIYSDCENSMAATRLHVHCCCSSCSARWSLRKYDDFQLLCLSLTFMVSCIVNEFFLSITNKMQHYTIFFITVNAVHVLGVFPPIIRSKRTVHTASGMCLLLPLAEAASKLGTYQMLCVQFLSSWRWAEKPPETCRALTAIKNVV